MTTIEPHRENVSALTAQAALACATADVCDAYFVAFVVYNEAIDRGDVVDHAAKVRLLTDQGDTFGAFIAAQRRGPSARENLHVAEVAARSFVARFDCPEDEKAKYERWLLDAVVGPMRRLPEPRTLAEQALVSPVMGDLAARLAALLTALETDRGDGQGPRTQAACAAVKASISDALGRGAEMVSVQTALDWWREATSGPQIIVSAAHE